MSTKILLLSCIFCFGLFSCSAPQEKKLTPEDKDKIKDEISSMVDSIKTSANELRTDYFKKIYSNDDQFIGVDLTGAHNYDEYMKETDDMYANMKSIEFMEDKVSMVVFDNKTVIALFEGKAKGESKDGVKMNLNNFHASMLFRKVDGQWKVAYTHESADQEIIMPPDSTIVEEPME
jgi:ketosteroid isomerase-like protein